MKKIIKYCDACDQGFAERFSFCPNCSRELKLFTLTAGVSREEASLPPPSKESTTEPLIPAGGQPRIEDQPQAREPQANIQSENIRPPNLLVSKEIGSPESAESAEATDNYESTKEYGGIGRLSYFVLMLVLGFINNMLASSRGRFDSEPSPLISLVVLTIAICLAAARLKNIGVSGWLSLLGLVPIANLWIGYRCLAQQEGYVETKELDGAGKIVTFIYLAFIGLIVFAILLYFVRAS